MDSIILEKTKSTPFVRLDPEKRKIEFKGESFPENAAKFFAPLFSWMRDYLATEFQELTVEIEMTYFNSSTSKAFMNMLEMFEKAVLSGKNVVVNWRCREDNETILEAGEEFKEDAPSLTFNIVTYKEE